MERPSPSVSGHLVDPDGRQWTLRRAKLDSRIARRMLKQPTTPALLGEAAGARLHWITTEERPNMLEQVHRCYARPGSVAPACDVEYMGHEFTEPSGARLLYIETWC
jgi:hypothetical protein